MKLTLWVSVSRNTRNVHTDHSALFYKKLETDYVPLNGDRVILFPYEDNPTDGPIWQTKSRYMDANGDWAVELTKIVINPTEDVLAQIDRSYTSAHPWWSKDVDKPIEDILTDNGWHEND